MAQQRASQSETIALPKPALTGATSLEQLLAKRRSIREYPATALKLAEIGQLLWAAQGITHPQGYRTAPSAGALYPLQLYLVIGTVQDLVPAVYGYDPDRHHLVLMQGGDRRNLLASTALGQDWLANTAAIVVFAADYKRTTRKYGERGKRYVHMEAGHAAENLFLQANALDLTTVIVGAFDDEEVANILRLPMQEQPLILMPIGRKE